MAYFPMNMPYFVDLFEMALAHARVTPCLERNGAVQIVAPQGAEVRHMNDKYDKAIADLKAEIAERMRMINSLLKLQNQPAMYPDPDGSAMTGSTQIRPDQFYSSGLATAVREYLTMRKHIGPATLDEIYAALVTGSFRFENREENVAKPALKQSLTKNTAIFHRLPNGFYGLAEWYPNRRNQDEADDRPKKRRGKSTKAATKPDKQKKAAAPTKATETTPPASTPTSRPTTLKDSVRAAVAAAKGEFTKQDVLDWINKHHPELDATKRRESLFSMVSHMQEELGLDVVKESKGTSPRTYRRNVAAENGHHN